MGTRLLARVFERNAPYTCYMVEAPQVLYHSDIPMYYFQISVTRRKGGVVMTNTEKR